MTQTATTTVDLNDESIDLREHVQAGDIVLRVGYKTTRFIRVDSVSRRTLWQRLNPRERQKINRSGRIVGVVTAPMDHAIARATANDERNMEALLKQRADLNREIVALQLSINNTRIAIVEDSKTEAARIAGI
jgi:hypothetical protein